MSDAAGIVVLIGRILFSVFFINTGLGFHVRSSRQAEDYARAMGWPVPAVAGWPAGLWLGLGALSIALGIWPDVGALMIGLFVIFAGLWFHRFWALDDPDQKMTQMQLFFRNVITLGAVLVMFGFFVSAGEGLRYTITGPLFSF
jgi:putative oxidoreductase